MSTRLWRVLIVDDNEMNRNMLARRLERKGYVTSVASGAQRLLRQVEEDSTDLILLDISMPEITGFEALQTLRARYTAVELPIIMVTAKNQSEDIVNAFDLGANDYITKPIDFPVALARIRLHLSVKEAEENLREREQGRIGQDLHDGLGQHLTGIAFMSKLLEKNLAVQSHAEAANAARIVQQVNEAISKTRELSRGLLPVSSEAMGLISALERAVEEVQNRFGLACRLICPEPVLLDDSRTATHLYRIAQEAMNNAVKHAKATRIDITLAKSAGGLLLSIKDNGVGFSIDNPSGGGIGLRIMRHRAKMVGGALSIERVPEGGTLITCRLSPP